MVLRKSLISWLLKIFLSSIETKVAIKFPIKNFFFSSEENQLGAESRVARLAFLCQLSQIWHIVKWLAVKKLLVGISA